MNKSINRYYLQLQPLTPIHIGSGEEVMPYEYIIEDNKYYRINLFDLINVLPSEKREELVNIMEKDLVKLRSVISDYDWKSSVLYEADTTSDFSVDYNKNIKRSANNLAIDEFINSKMRPYIPGSSIKGAFRTAYIYNYADNIYYDISRNRHGFFDVRNSRGKAQTIEQRTLNYKDMFGDPFQTVKFSDSSLNISNLKIYKTYSVNVKKANTDGIPYYQEVIAGLLSSNIEQNIFLELSIDLARQNCDYSKNSVKHSITAKKLLKATRKFSKDIIEAELNYLRDKNTSNDTVNIYKHLKGIHNTLDENQSLIRFGKGVGFNTTTLNLANEKTTVQPVSRVLADSKYPMGWAIISLNEEKHDISILNNKEIKQKSKKLEKEKEEKIKKKKSKYPNLMAYIKGEYGNKTARKVAIRKSKGKVKLYNKYKKEYEEFLRR